MSSHEIIADSSTLSNFARSGHFDLLQQLFPDGVWTTAEVITEIGRGVTKYPSLQVLLNTQGAWLKIIDQLSPAELQIQQRLKAQYATIRKGADSSVLAVAKERDWVVMTDDERGGKGMIMVAKQEGIPVLRTIDLLREAMQRRFLTPVQSRRVKADIDTKARFRIKDPDP